MAPRQRVTTSNSGSSEDAASAPRRETEPIILSSSSGKKLNFQNGESSDSTHDNNKHPVVEHEVDIKDRDRHDIFNLVALPIMLGTILLNWDLGVLLHGGALEDSWSNDYLNELLFVVCLYFLLDLTWVAIVPTCVKSPGTIIKHHIVALIYLYGPVVMPNYRCYMGVILCVELNTWFLIARRVLYLRKDTIPTVVRDLVDYAFYVSWIIIRVFAYNWLLYRFYRDFHLRIVNHETLALPSVFVATQTALNLMNLKWTYDLFTPMIKRMLSPMSSKTKTDSEHTL